MKFGSDAARGRQNSARPFLARWFVHECLLTKAVAVRMDPRSIAVKQIIAAFFAVERPNRVPVPINV
jgi:hypothetical protein